MCDKVLLRKGIDIALRYFNYTDQHDLPVLTRQARVWSASHYGGYYHFPAGANPLTQLFPQLFNLSTQPHLRLARRQTAPPYQEPYQEKDTDTDTDTEPFPVFMEPIMASDDDINEVLGLRCRQPRGMPKMRVSARDLQNSGLLVALPEFLSQLAHGDLIASAAKKAPEAPEETLPTPPSTARPTPTPNSPAHYGRKGSASVPMSWQDGLGIQVEDEADKCPFSSDKGSRKRKASSALEPSSTSSTLLPCKVRLAIQYYPPLKLERFDLALGTTVVVDNPAARDLSPDPFAALQVARRAAAEAKKVKTEDEEEDDEDVFSPALPASPRIIKIKVPPRPGPAAEQLQQQQQQQELLTPPPTSPPVPSSPPPPPARRIIKLRDPRWSPAAPGSGVVRIKVVRKAGGLAAE